jgi:hypothetical protein
LADANDALERATRFVAGFRKEERIRFGDLVRNLQDSLHGELLPAIYAQHPDMEPPLIDEEVPTIDSELEWDQVQLPPAVTVLDFDRVVLSELRPHWRKTAMIVIRVWRHYLTLGIDISPEIVAARLIAMADSDLIEDIGDLRMWRYSEVRLKD